MNHRLAERLFKEAGELAGPLIYKHGEPPAELDDSARARLRRAMTLYDEVVRLTPHHWAALWVLGKIHERFGDNDRALEAFAAAFERRPDHPDVAREASIAAMKAGQADRAINYCERAVMANPNDPGLRANLALALLFSGQPDRASVVAEDALERDPSDEITRNIVTLVRDVLAGKRPCPRSDRDLQE